MSLRAGTGEEYPRPKVCGFHMQKHATAAEQAACDADYENYVRLQEEADDKTLSKWAESQGKTVDEVRALFREIAQAVWDGAVINH